MPHSLGDALNNLEEDHEFLLKGDVFSQDTIEAWIEYKREAEIAPMALRPTPHEFELYFDM
jgi:glutamine synthetase